ncbi:hypothetical protein AB0G04_41085 [Actinoplanes sp. NPDC023801]|uniref:hypothetical protein n=1 Tax=Actinoplanes sp. NPDC023801 TaxID=3154595 RepID=UPI0033D11998
MFVDARPVTASDAVTRPSVLRAASPGDVVLGSGNVTSGPVPDLLIRRPDGTLLILEPDGRGGARGYRCADGFDDVMLIGVADITGDGYAGLVGLTDSGEVVVFPHTGVFWPQDPSAAFGGPVVLAECIRGSGI